MDCALGIARISRQLGKDGPGTEDAGPGSQGHHLLLMSFGCCRRTTYRPTELPAEKGPRDSHLCLPVPSTALCTRDPA